MTAVDRSVRQAVPDSFIHAARRDQLVQSAIEVIAELGATAASVVKIAQRAGVSRGVVAYHFRDTDDLADAVVAEVYRLGAERLAHRVADAGGPRAAVLEFVGGSVEFYAEFPQHMLALQEIFAARRRSRTGSRGTSAEHVRERADVVTLLRAGQDSGAFRSFDAVLMAEAIRSVLDTALPRVLAGGADVTDLRDELVATVDAMTRKDPSS